MNSYNHFIFSIFLCLLFLEFTRTNFFYAVIFSLVFAVLIDLDHIAYFKAKLKFKTKIIKLKKHKEEELEFLRRSSHLGPYPELHTWLQEPFGLILIGVPIAIALSLINKNFFPLVIVAMGSHIFLDYLCIFPARPLEPFSNKEYKRLGEGPFYPHSPSKWKKLVKREKMKAKDEFFFGAFVFLALVLIVLLKGGVF